MFQQDVSTCAELGPAQTKQPLMFAFLTLHGVNGRFAPD